MEGLEALACQIVIHHTSPIWHVLPENFSYHHIDALMRCLHSTTVSTNDIHAKRLITLSARMHKGQADMQLHYI